MKTIFIVIFTLLCPSLLYSQEAIPGNSSGVVYQADEITGTDNQGGGESNNQKNIQLSSVDQKTQIYKDCAAYADEVLLKKGEEIYLRFANMIAADGCAREMNKCDGDEIHFYIKTYKAEMDRLKDKIKGHLNRCTPNRVSEVDKQIEKLMIGGISRLGLVSDFKSWASK